MRIYSRLLYCLSSVTTLPGISIPEDEENALDGLAKYLPTVGLILGAILFGVSWLMLDRLHLRPELAAAIVTVLWLCLTGALHFDGLMDAADGIFSHRSRERILEIMHDSRVGNFGALTGISVLLLKYASLAYLLGNAPILAPVLVLTPAWSRWSELYAIAAFPYAREEGRGKIWHDSTSHPKDTINGAMLPLAITIVLCMTGDWRWPLLISVSACLTGIFVSRWLANRLHGHTGDTYGTVVELSEMGSLLVVASCLQYMSAI